MINIYSGSKQENGLAAALTNPTELAFTKGNIAKHYPVRFMNLMFADAEAAYKKFKTGNLAADKKLMVRIIACKLDQHPELVTAIARRGGLAWLENCCHKTAARNQRWEGDGRNSNFIDCLAIAYQSQV
jgi:hypothetical protein